MNLDPRVVIVEARLAKKLSRNRKMACTRILNWMIIFGFIVNNMLRFSLNISIIDMVSNINTSVPNDAIKNVANGSVLSSNCTTVSTECLPTSSVKFNWSVYDQNLISGSFYWGYVITEFPGGRMAEKIGTRPIFGYAMLLASIVTLLTPTIANLGLWPIVSCRILLGFILGVTWPAVQPIAANWIPPNERSKFIANMMASNLGAGFTLLMCGALISALGWESVFYITGLVGVIWSMFWFRLVYETPAEHPRITEYEKNYIETQIAEQSSAGIKPKQIPWTKILTSWPVWAIIITHGANVFCYYTISIQLPTYMKYLLHYEIKMNGLLSSLPYFSKFITAFFVGIIADKLINYEKMSRTTTRKVFTSIGLFLPGILMIAQVYFGENRVWSVLIFILALTLNGAVSGGYLGNALDIAPNFSGTIFGLASTLSSFGGFLSTYIVGELTDDNHTFEQWQIVFWILAITYTVGGLVFLIFGTAKTLPWNSIPTKEVQSDQPIIMVY